jgi:hypothetical protein
MNKINGSANSTFMYGFCRGLIDHKDAISGIDIDVSKNMVHMLESAILQSCQEVMCKYKS